MYKGTADASHADVRPTRGMLSTQEAIMATESSGSMDLVCEGGGVRGIALVGALEVLEEAGYVAQNRAGTSAGAIVSTLHAAGFEAKEMRDIITETKFSSFIDLGALDRIPIVGAPIGVLYEHGIFEGDSFYTWIRALLDERGVRTFGDLVHPDFADEESIYRYKVQVIVTDLSSRQLLVLPRDAEKLGIHPDELEVALAVRMSMSIPFFFEPVRFRNKKTHTTHVIVDGGVLSNFPIWLFDTTGAPEWPTFGLRLVDEAASSEAITDPTPEVARIPKGPIGLFRYGQGLIETLLEAHDRLYIEKAQFARTIPIPTCGVGTVDFLLSDADAERLYASGRTAAKDFLKRWNFATYKREFRGRKKHSRTRDMAGILK
jgi:NTE family protein